jgi:UDPglucose 6-dehydrogenase
MLIHEERRHSGVRQQRRFMRIAMIGSGYVGLVSGACLADFGHSVVCVDKDPLKIARLNDGDMPIYEPGLDRLVASNVAAGRLRFTTALEEAVANADVVFIGVGTPERRGDGRADVSYVHAAAREIAQAATGFTVIVTKSTVPVGTGDDVEKIVRETNPHADILVISNPEFLREGAAIDDFKRPDRIVIGLEDDRAKAVMEEVYRPLFLNQAPILFARRRTAELIKYAANAFLAMKITFINEISDLCEVLGADVQQVAQGVGLDRRIGPKFLHAGPGYGGSCFPKDTVALARTAQDHGRPLRLIEATIAINEARKRAMAERVIAAAGGTVLGKTIGLLGLTFKPNTDDVREAPAISIARALMEAGAHIRAFDPEGMIAMAQAVPGIDYATSPYAAADGAAALVIVTEWDSFRALDLSELRRRMADPVLIDLRNVYEPQDAERAGFLYVGLGRAGETARPPLLQAAE